MQEIMTRSLKILPSICDNTSRISIPSIFALFQDLASEHGTYMHVGTEDLAPKGLFWLTVRTKIHIEHRPSMMEDLDLRTWPEKPGRVRCNRYYEVSQNGQPLILGKTEWAVIHLESGRLQKLSEVYPAEMEHCPDVALAEPFTRISEDFTDCEVLDTYKVKSTDIDMGQHLNNAAYARILFGAFSTQELTSMDIHDAEIAFRTPCYEGDVLTIHKRVLEDGSLEIGILRDDGKAAATCKLQ